MGDLEDDNERLEFRKQLSELSFEQLIELKRKVGLKVFNETVAGKDKTPKLEFKRTHKKRPREMSSKIPVDPFRKVVPLSSLKVFEPRDPRFDSSCGEYNEKIFKKDYSFVKDMRESEKNILKQRLAKVKNPDKKKNIKLLIQRIENKEREEKRKVVKEEADNTERMTRKQAVLDGKKAYFYKKSEKKLIDLVDSYESLKKSGNLKKHIERKLKSKKAKDRNKHGFRRDSN